MCVLFRSTCTYWMQLCTCFCNVHLTVHHWKRHNNIVQCRYRDFITTNNIYFQCMMIIKHTTLQLKCCSKIFKSYSPWKQNKTFFEIPVNFIYSLWLHRGSMAVSLKLYKFCDGLWCEIRIGRNNIIFPLFGVGYNRS